MLGKAVDWVGVWNVAELLFMIGALPIVPMALRAAERWLDRHQEPYDERMLRAGRPSPGRDVPR